MKVSIIVLIIFLLCSFALAENQVNETALTIYNDNLAVIKQKRKIVCEEGINTIKFPDVAATIDPTSVIFNCLSDVNVNILEQNHEYDLQNSESLLEKYLNEEVVISIKGSGSAHTRRLTGELIQIFPRQLLIKTEDNEIEIVKRDSIESISLENMPFDIFTESTLIWLIEAEKKSEPLCQISYIASNLSWHADYLAVVKDQPNTIDLSGWVTIYNKSGIDYKDSEIKLIAGDVHRVKQQKGVYMDRVAMAAPMQEEQSFQQKGFMEYHMYTLGRKASIRNLEKKQIEFIQGVSGIPYTKLFLYKRSAAVDKVQINMEFRSPEMQLPKGRVRVFKEDAEKILEFIGEDMISHTPKNEKISLNIGNAFDIVSEYTLLDTKRERRRTEQTHKIELRNRKDVPVTVFVEEDFPSWVNWKVLSSTDEYEQKDSSTIRFEIKIKPDSVETIQYTAEQVW